MGPDPGLELVFPNKSLHYWPVWHQPMERRLKSHPKQYGGMLEPSFRTQDERDIVLGPKPTFSHIDKH